VPAVLIGSALSSRAPDRVIRPVITFVIFASGLKYVGVGTRTLGLVLPAVALAGLLWWLAGTQPWRRGRAAAVPVAARVPVTSPVPDAAHSTAEPPANRPSPDPGRR